MESPGQRRVVIVTYTCPWCRRELRHLDTPIARRALLRRHRASSLHQAVIRETR
jgi:hypothetical protein